MTEKTTKNSMAGKCNKDLTPEEILLRNKYQKELYEKNKAKKLARQRELYALKHKEKKKEYYEKNKAELNKKALERYHSDEFNIKEKMKGRYKSNKQYINERQKQRNFIRYKLDRSYRIKAALRTVFNDFLRQGYNTCVVSYLTSCSNRQLLEHIESSFKPGMDWDNRSEWHIDHIKPLKDFDLTQLAGIRKAYYWKNLDVKWAKDNLNKGGNNDANN